MIHQIKRYLRNLFQERSQADTISLNKKQIEAVSSDEELSRFIFSSNHLTKDKTVVKGAAFLPNSSLKTSVFRKSRMSADEYDEKKGTIANLRGKSLKAAALIKVSSVLDSKLRVEPEEEEHRWHADLINWPVDKEERKSIAQDLAYAARVEVL